MAPRVWRCGARAFGGRDGSDDELAAGSHEEDQASEDRDGACRKIALPLNLAAMDLDVFWNKPVDLREDHDDGLILSA